MRPIEDIIFPKNMGQFSKKKLCILNQPISQEQKSSRYKFVTAEYSIATQDQENKQITHSFGKSIIVELLSSQGEFNLIQIGAQKNINLMIIQGDLAPGSIFMCPPGIPVVMLGTIAAERILIGKSPLYLLGPIDHLRLRLNPIKIRLHDPHLNSYNRMEIYAAQEDHIARLNFLAYRGVELIINDVSHSKKPKLERPKQKEELSTPPVIEEKGKRKESTSSSLATFDKKPKLEKATPLSQEIRKQQFTENLRIFLESSTIQGKKYPFPPTPRQKEVLEKLYGYLQDKTTIPSAVLTAFTSFGKTWFMILLAHLLPRESDGAVIVMISATNLYKQFLDDVKEYALHGFRIGSLQTSDAGCSWQVQRTKGQVHLSQTRKKISGQLTKCADITPILQNNDLVLVIYDTFQNIISRLKENKESFPTEWVPYLFIDEAHHACSPTIKPIIQEDFKNCSRLVVTATPYPTIQAKASAKSKQEEEDTPYTLLGLTPSTNPLENINLADAIRNGDVPPLVMAVAKESKELAQANLEKKPSKHGDNNRLCHEGAYARSIAELIFNQRDPVSDEPLHTRGQVLIFTGATIEQTREFSQQLNNLINNSNDSNNSAIRQRIKDGLWKKREAELRSYYQKQQYGKPLIEKELSSDKNLFMKNFIFAAAVSGEDQRLLKSKKNASNKAKKSSDSNIQSSAASSSLILNDDILEKCKRREVFITINPLFLKEGFSCNGISLVIKIGPINSLIDLYQMVGRGERNDRYMPEKICYFIQIIPHEESTSNLSLLLSEQPEFVLGKDVRRIYSLGAVDQNRLLHPSLRFLENDIIKVMVEGLSKSNLGFKQEAKDNQPMTIIPENLWIIRLIAEYLLIDEKDKELMQPGPSTLNFESQHLPVFTIQWQAPKIIQNSVTLHNRKKVIVQNVNIDDKNITEPSNNAKSNQFKQISLLKEFIQKSQIALQGLNELTSDKQPIKVIEENRLLIINSVHQPQSKDKEDQETIEIKQASAPSDHKQRQKLPATATTEEIRDSIKQLSKELESLSKQIDQKMVTERRKIKDYGADVPVIIKRPKPTKTKGSSNEGQAVANIIKEHKKLYLVATKVYRLLQNRQLVNQELKTLFAKLKPIDSIEEPIALSQASLEEHYPGSSIVPPKLLPIPITSSLPAAGSPIVHHWKPDKMGNYHCYLTQGDWFNQAIIGSQRTAARPAASGNPYTLFSGHSNSTRQASTDRRPEVLSASATLERMVSAPSQPSHVTASSSLPFSSPEFIPSSATAGDEAALQRSFDMMDDFNLPSLDDLNPYSSPKSRNADEAALQQSFDMMDDFNLPSLDDLNPYSSPRSKNAKVDWSVGGLNSPPLTNRWEDGDKDLDGSADTNCNLDLDFPSPW